MATAAGHLPPKAPKQRHPLYYLSDGNTVVQVRRLSFGFSYSTEPTLIPGGKCTLSLQSLGSTLQIPRSSEHPPQHSTLSSSEI